jgi:hypothetical protein
VGCTKVCEEWFCRMRVVCMGAGAAVGLGGAAVGPALTRLGELRSMATPVLAAAAKAKAAKEENNTEGANKGKAEKLDGANNKGSKGKGRAGGKGKAGGGDVLAIHTKGEFPELGHKDQGRKEKEYGKGGKDFVKDARDNKGKEREREAAAQVRPLPGKRDPTFAHFVVYPATCGSYVPALG